MVCAAPATKPHVTLRAMALLCLSWTNIAQAQAELRVIFVGESPTDSAWVRSLRTELRAEGGELVRGSEEAIEGPTAARAQARSAHADAAVWIESEAGAIHVHALVMAAPGELAATLDEGGDSRTVALVVVSLLDDALHAARATQARLTPLTPAPPPSALLDRPLATNPERTASRYAAWVVEEGIGGSAAGRRGAEPAPAFESKTYAGFGLGASAFMTDAAFDMGGFLRAVLGVRLGDLVRVQANLEGGVYNDNLGEGPEAQPFGRLCPEAALAPRIGERARVWIGVHGCVGLAEARFFVVRVDLVLKEDLVVNFAVGGFLGFSIPLGEGMNLWIRADLDGTTPFGVSREPNVLGSLSTTLEIF